MNETGQTQAPQTQDAPQETPDTSGDRSFVPEVGPDVEYIIFTMSGPLPRRFTDADKAHEHARAMQAPWCAVVPAVKQPDNEGVTDAG